MGRQQYEERTTELATPIIQDLGLEFVDVEFVKEGQDYYLRIFIDKPGGVTIDDCVAVTEPMNQRLDQEDFIKEAYIFEVSSPGLDRPLKKDKDFQRALGERVEMKLFEPIEGVKELIATLQEHNENSIRLTEIETGKKNPPEALEIQKKNLAIIRRHISF